MVRVADDQQPLHDDGLLLTRWCSGGPPVPECMVEPPGSVGIGAQERNSMLLVGCGGLGIALG